MKSDAPWRKVKGRSFYPWKGRWHTERLYDVLECGDALPATQEKQPKRRRCRACGREAKGEGS